MSVGDFLLGLFGFGGMAKDAIMRSRMMNDPDQQMIMPDGVTYLDAEGSLRFFDGRKAYRYTRNGQAYIADRRTGKSVHLNALTHAKRIKEGIENTNYSAIWYGEAFGRGVNSCMYVDDPDHWMVGHRFYDRETGKVLTIRTFYDIPELYYSNKAFYEEHKDDKRIQEVHDRLRNKIDAEFYVDVETKKLVRLSDYQLISDKNWLEGKKEGCACGYGQYEWVDEFIRKQNEMHQYPQNNDQRPELESFRWNECWQVKEAAWRYQKHGLGQCEIGRDAEIVKGSSRPNRWRDKYEPERIERRREFLSKGDETFLTTIEARIDYAPVDYLIERYIGRDDLNPLASTI